MVLQRQCVNPGARVSRRGAAGRRPWRGGRAPGVTAQWAVTPAGGSAGVQAVCRTGRITGRGLLRLFGFEGGFQMLDEGVVFMVLETVPFLKQGKCCANQARYTPVGVVARGQRVEGTLYVGAAGHGRGAGGSGGAGIRHFRSLWLWLWLWRCCCTPVHHAVAAAVMCTFEFFSRVVQQFPGLDVRMNEGATYRDTGGD